MSLIDLTITPREKDLGGFSVRRILPYAQRRMVGPFIFLDHMGPAHFDAGHGMDVRPHPHIGLATVTYLFEGEIFHRDSLGSALPILPGAVNWMTAGRGITHSERSGEQARATARNLHGLQSWIALPKEAEDVAPEFHHHPANTLPEFTHGNVAFKIIAGSAYGHEAPVKIFSPLFYVEARMPAGTTLKLPDGYRERSLYLVDGDLRIGNTSVVQRSMCVFGNNKNIVVEALAPSHLVLLGGDPFPEQRYIDWNFVATSEERIEAAKADWREGRFAKVPGDEQEFIPLPG